MVASVCAPHWSPSAVVVMAVGGAAALQPPHGTVRGAFVVVGGALVEILGEMRPRVAVEVSKGSGEHIAP